MENSRLCSDKSPVSPLPVQLHLIRSARRRDSAARGTGRTKFTANLIGERGGRRGESDDMTNVDGNGEQKSRDGFHLISRYYQLAVAITVVPLYHHGAAGSRAVLPFPFPPFWSWLLTVIRRLPYTLKDGGRCFPYRSAATAIFMNVYMCVYAD